MQHYVATATKRRRCCLLEEAVERLTKGKNKKRGFQQPDKIGGGTAIKQELPQQSPWCKRGEGAQNEESKEAKQKQKKRRGRNREVKVYQKKAKRESKGYESTANTKGHKASWQGPSDPNS